MSDLIEVAIIGAWLLWPVALAFGLDHVRGRRAE